jgi:hypothetical protein
MKNYVRVFLKGEPMRWFDFPIEQGGTLFAFNAQALFEGFAIGATGMIAYDQIRCMMLIQTATPTLGLGGMQPAAQA